jgi:phosphatidylserine decarboxylase
MGDTYYEENDERMNIIGQNGNDGLHYDEQEEIVCVWDGQYLKVDLVDTTTECSVKNNTYSLTEMMDLHQELVEAFDVTIKKLQELGHNTSLDKDNRNGS